MEIEVEKRFVVHEFKQIMGTDNLALVKVEFGGLVINFFDTEQDALNALISKKKTYTDYVILPVYHLRERF